MSHRILSNIGRTAALVATLIALLTFPRDAHAVKYMKLKEAIKYFLPDGHGVFNVKKSIPPDKMAQVKKRFALRDTVDFKETLSPGPYSVYLGKDAAGKVSVYILILEQYWRTCHHKYAIGLTPDGKIKEVVVVELNCRYAYAINKKAFLKQFKGKKAPKGSRVPARAGEDVDIITGATASSDATAIVARRALALFEVFFSN